MVPFVETDDGSMVPVKQYQPCGGVALFDGGWSYRCLDCLAVVGSMGQPSSCKEQAAKYENWQKLGGKGWDYDKGCVK